MRTLITVFAAIAAVVGSLFSCCMMVGGSPLGGVALGIASVAPGMALVAVHWRRRHRPFQQELDAVRAIRAVPVPTFPQMRSPESVSARRPPSGPVPGPDPQSVPAEEPVAVPDDDRPTPPRTMLPPPMTPEARRAQMRLVHTDGRRLSAKQIRKRPQKW